MRSENRTIKVLWLAVGIFVIISLACNLPVQLSGNQPADNLEDLDAALAIEKIDDRPGVIEALGLPDAFDIAIVKVDDSEVRLESWRYYQYGTRVDFVDGEAIFTMEIEPMPDGTLFAAWYNPLDFEAGMSADVASSVASAASPARTTLQKIDTSPGGEDLDGGWVLVGDQILIGLEQSGLVYVETVALVPGDGER